MKKELLVISAIALLSSTAFAGLYQPALITVDLEGKIASGDMLSTANSVNSDALIGCGVRSIDNVGGSSFRFGFCQAQDDAGNAVVCITQSPTLLDEMRAINDFSFISFSWEDDGNGNFACTRVGVSTQSFYLDKVKN